MVVKCTGKRRRTESTIHWQKKEKKEKKKRFLFAVFHALYRGMFSLNTRLKSVIVLKILSNKPEYLSNIKIPYEEVMRIMSTSSAY